MYVRLFAEEEFDALEPRPALALLHVSLSHAVLQLLEFGVKDVLKFEMMGPRLTVG